MHEPLAKHNARMRNDRQQEPLRIMFAPASRMRLPPSDVIKGVRSWQTRERGQGFFVDAKGLLVHQKIAKRKRLPGQRIDMGCFVPRASGSVHK